MIQVIQSHWASYLFLAWLAVIVIVNLWLWKKPARKPKTTRILPPRAERLSAPEPFDAKLEPAHRKR